MNLDIRGAIIPNDDAWIYDWFGEEYTSPKMVRSAMEEAAGDKLDVYISSGGGDVFSGSEIYEALRQYKGDVKIHVTGIAASAASVIACARKSDIAPTAQMMVHRVSAYAAGNTADMTHMAETLRKADRAIAAAYVAKTGMSEEEALGMMERETWLTAEDAVKAGLIDEISEPVEKEAQIPLVAAANNMIPEAVIRKMKLEREAAEIDLLQLKGARS